MLVVMPGNLTILARLVPCVQHGEKDVGELGGRHPPGPLPTESLTAYQAESKVVFFLSSRYVQVHRTVELGL